MASMSDNEDSQSSRQSFGSIPESTESEPRIDCTCDPRMVAMLVVKNKRVRKVHAKKEKIEKTLEQYLARRYSLTMGQLNSAYQNNPKPIPRSTIEKVELPPMKKMRKFPKLKRNHRYMYKQSPPKKIIVVKDVDDDLTNNFESSLEESFQGSSISLTDTNISLPENRTTPPFAQNMSPHISLEEPQVNPSPELNRKKSEKDDEPQNDECDDFAQRIAAQLKRLKSPAARAKAKLIIQEALFKDTTDSFD